MPFPGLVGRVSYHLDAGVPLALRVLAAILFQFALVCCLGRACYRRAGVPAHQPEGSSPPREVQGFAVPLQRRRGVQAS